MKYNILVIDDNASLAYSIKEFLLSDVKFQKVDTVQSAKKGIELLESGVEYDLVLLDLIMPEHDGIYFLKTIGEKGFKKVPYIAVHTQLSNDTFINIIMKNSVDYIFIKPFEIGNLKDRILDICSLRYENKEIVENEMKNSTLDNYVTKTVVLSGILPNQRGYYYIIEAIKLCIINEEKMKGITKVLYKEIGEKFGTTNAGVERAIRNCINKAWEKDKMKDFCEHFKYPNDVKKLTNLGYISTIVAGYKNL